MRILLSSFLVKGLAIAALSCGAVMATPPKPAGAAEIRAAISGVVSAPMEMQRRIVRPGMRVGARPGMRVVGPGVRPGFRPGGRVVVGRRGGNFGPGLALGAAGLIIGGAAIAASQPAYARECWYERRWVETPYGDMVRRRVRVCE